MAAQTYKKCLCGHKDVAHAVTDGHPCRYRDCDCLAFLNIEHAEQENDRVSDGDNRWQR